MADPNNYGANLGAYLGNNGKKGGHPGAGRPRSEVRDAFQAAGAECLPMLIAIANDKTKRPKDIIDAIKAMLQYGMGNVVEVQLSNDRVLTAIARASAKYIKPEDFKAWEEDCKKAIQDV